jgi:hypothetical protein
MNTISESANPWRPTIELAVAPASASTSASTSPTAKDTPTVDNGEETGEFKLFGDDGFTFLDFLDIINPLQHIPVIGTLYRMMTDDTLDPGSRVLGGTLFLGPLGTVASLANVIIDDATGKDMGEHVLAFFEDEEGNAPQISAGEDRPVAIAAATPMVTSLSLGGIQVADVETGAIDPVTAWAMAETSYRKSTAGKSTNTHPGAASMPDEVRPYREQAAAPKPALGWNSVSPTTRPTTQDSARAPVRGSAWGPARGIDALAALRSDLKAGGVVKTAETANASRDIRQRSSSLAAATYERQQAANIPRKSNAATPPPGAIAAEGGWFTGTMLSALGRYQEGANIGGSAIAGNPRQAGVDLTR